VPGQRSAVLLRQCNPARSPHSCTCRAARVDDVAHGRAALGPQQLHQAATKGGPQRRVPGGVHAPAGRVHDRRMHRARHRIHLRPRSFLVVCLAPCLRLAGSTVCQEGKAYPSPLFVGMLHACLARRSGCMQHRRA
jgi:hypothetical protein